jgi:CPA1 family monovalent cation:H+ antiporter
MMTANLSAFDIAAIVIVLVAVLSYLNHRFLKLQPTIGLVVMGALASTVVVAIDWAVPQSHMAPTLLAFLDKVDFRRTLLNGMLSFLLFAGSLHVDLSLVRLNKWPIAVLSTVGVVVSTVIVGAGLKAISMVAGIDAPLMWCLVFGALISPTDPVAVLSILKTAKAPQSVEATVAGESLFNDGVGVVVFTILLAAATGAGQVTALDGARMFAVEAIGGAAFGLVIGWIAYLGMKSIEDANVEVMLSLAVVMGGAALAQAIGVSGPIAMVAAGLLIGNHGVANAMDDHVRDYMLKFWTLIDEILNAVLFLLVGLESAALLREGHLVLVGLAAIPLVLIARALSVGAPLVFWGKRLPYRIAFPVLTWGGLRGGLSIAMALSLPDGPLKPLLLTTTYVVVLFSVVVQGSTIGMLVKRLGPSAERKTGPTLH